MLTEDYVRKARVLRVVDGDTLDVEIDLGFKVWVRRRLRVLGVNCPERKGATREAGDAAREAVCRWLEETGTDTVMVRTPSNKEDSFGRVLAEVWLNDGKVDLSQLLLGWGHAVPYEG